MHRFVLAQFVDRIPDLPPQSTGMDMALPSRQQYLDGLGAMDVLPAVLLVGLGLMYMLYGWKIFKWLVVLNFAFLGGVLGYRLGLWEGSSANMPIFLAVLGALLLGAVAWPLMKAGVSILGAVTGGLLGYGLWHHVACAVGKPMLAQYAWAGGLVGLIALGLLAFIVFRIVVLVFTSFQGGSMMMTGLLALLVKHEVLGHRLLPTLRDSYLLLPSLLVIPMLIGFTFQYVWSKPKKKPQ